MNQKIYSRNEQSAGTRPPTPTAPSKKTVTAVNPSRDKIAKRAYSLYLDQGCPEGQDVQHWLEAEAQLGEAHKDVSKSVSM